MAMFASSSWQMTQRPVRSRCDAIACAFESEGELGSGREASIACVCASVMSNEDATERGKWLVV